jgi:hypothetical protein
MKKLFLTYLDVVLKFFGLQRIIGESEVITYNGEEIQVVTEKELVDPKLERFNEILEYCDKTHGPTGPKWDVDKNRPMFIEPDVIDEHNSDPNRGSKMDYNVLVDDEQRQSANKLKKQDPLYVNSVTRRKARAKIVGENTNTKARQQRKSKSTLTPEDETFESLRKEILKNITED